MAIWHSLSCTCQDCLETDKYQGTVKGRMKMGEDMFEDEEGDE